VLRTVNDQPVLWDSILPPELLVLPVELGRVDALLDDPVFFAPFAVYFDVRIGRPSIPVESYLWLMFLKFRYRLGYESLCREVADSISWQRFCRIPLGTRVLEQQPHGATNPDALTYRDAEIVIDAINRAERLDAKPYRASYKRHLYRRFFEVIEYGRPHDYLDQTPMSFGRRRSQVIPDDRVEESTGKASPIDIQRQLDANIDTIGRDIRYGTLNDEQRQIMFATAYILLRDTGRRTAEIASLKAGCLARDSNGPIMI
jgi:hypothetical protein